MGVHYYFADVVSLVSQATRPVLNHGEPEGPLPVFPVSAVVERIVLARVHLETYPFVTFCQIL